MFRDVLSCIKNSGNGFYGKHNAYKVNLLLQLFLFQLFVLWLHICQRRIKNPSNIWSGALSGTERALLYLRCFADPRFVNFMYYLFTFIYLLIHLLIYLHICIYRYWLKSLVFAAIKKMQSISHYHVINKTRSFM